MSFDVDRVRTNVRQAMTKDLLDRATVYREGMEPEALDIIEDELRKRGVTLAEQQAHEDVQRRASTVPVNPDGTAVRCSLCGRPAVRAGWGWHRLWGVVPLFPRRFRYCSEHLAR